MDTLATTSTENFDEFDTSNDQAKALFGGRVFTDADRLAGQQRRLEKIAAWSAMDTRQDFVDHRFMRGVLRAAGVRSPLVVEPATVQRLRLHLRRAGLQRAEVMEAVGTTIEGFLQLNPKLPLWAALAMVLEATGKYDKSAAEFADAEEIISQ
jgi:hypothetical protein